MNRKGLPGEEAAARYLASKGYRILCRNYVGRFGEIDVIAAKDDFLVFAEVKSKSGRGAERPAERVTAAKRQKLIKTALMYLAENATGLQPRFDVLEVEFRNSEDPENPNVQIRHLENAFFADGFGF